MAGGSGGQPGELFSFGANARALSMGSAHTAMVQDVSSIYYNPAGLGLLPGREITVMRATLYEGASYDYLAYAQNKRKRAGGWGAELIRLGISGAEGRDELNQPTGSFGYSEMALGLAQGWRGVFHPKLSAGMKFKMLNRSLAGSSDRLFGVDFGLQFGPLLSEKLMLGLVANNVLSYKQGDTDDALALLLRLGASYRVIGPLSLAADVSDSGEFRVGTEYVWGFSALRVGMVDQALSFGGGVNFRNKYTFDMAILNHPTLGMSQRISIGYRFGVRRGLAGGKAPKIQFYAADSLKKGEAALNDRDYLKASKDIDTALGMDPQVGDGTWVVKGERLRRLVKVIELQAHPEDKESFQKKTPSAFLAFQVIQAFMANELDRAMLLAHAALGAEARNPAYRRLLDSMGELAGRKVNRDQILPPERLTVLKMKLAVDEVYRQQFSLAAESLREALWLDPQNALAWTRLGSAYFAMGDKVRSGAAFRKALELNPRDEKLRGFVEAQGLR